jgi:hypothetical protein
MALTELYQIDARVGGLGPIRVVAGSLSASTDETIYTPPTGQHVYLLSEYYAEGTAAANPTYKSGSTAIVTPEIAANQGARDKVTDGFVLVSAAGAALKVNPAQDISSALYHIVVGKGMQL